MAIFNFDSNTANKNTDNISSVFANMTPAGSSKVPTSAPVFTPIPTPLKPAVDTSPVAYNSVVGSQQPVVGVVDNMQASNNLGTQSMNQVTVTPEPSARQKEMSSYSALIDKLGTQTERTLAIQEQNQFAQKNQILADANARALRTSQDFDRQEQQLMQNAQGQFGGGLTQSLNNLRRERNQAVSAIALEQAVALGNVNAAKDTIKMQVDAEFEPLKNQIAAKRDWFQLYNDDLSTSERITLENQMKKDTDKYNAGVKNATLAKGAETYQKFVDAGTMDIKDVPNEYIAYMSPVAKQKYTEETIQPILDKSNLIDSVLNNPALKGSVGTNPFARMGGFGLDKFTGNQQNFIASVSQLVQKETLDTILNLKKGGGTLGALSDPERIALQQAATKIGNWEMKDSNGKVTGYNVAEKDFKDELIKIQSLADKALLRADIIPVEKKVEILTKQISRDNPSFSLDDVKSAVNLALPTYTKQSFNKAGNATASNIADAIKTVESQGNYNARGPVVTSGAYKGERALGAYQVMPSNLPSWSKEALGRSVSEQEFLSNPSLQDQIVKSRFENLLKQYSPEDVASIWFSGRPLAKNNAKDVTGTSVPEYVRKVMNNLTA